MFSDARGVVSISERRNWISFSVRSECTGWCLSGLSEVAPSKEQKLYAGRKKVCASCLRIARTRKFERHSKLLKHLVAEIYFVRRDA